MARTERIELTAADGHRLGAFVAHPEGTPKGGVVVLQEIFGVNSHIRNVTMRFAAEGYTALAPALFDRAEPGFESGYTPEEIERARRFVKEPDVSGWLADTQAAIDHLRPSGPVGVVGYCLGGSLAFLAATRLSGLSAAVSYYGGMVARHAEERPAVPVQAHFGTEDHGIPMTDVEHVRQTRPEIDLHVYEGAQHGFNCDERPSYGAEHAALAWRRTLDFLDRHLG